MKKAVCLILCALLVGALMPAAVVSASGPDAVFASAVLTGGTEKCLYSADGAIEAMILDPNPQSDPYYDLPEGVRYDPASNTLYLTDFNAPDTTLLLTAMGGDFRLCLAGSNSLAAIRSDSLGLGGSITFCGLGALELVSLSEAAVFVNGGGAPDFVRFEPECRVTAVAYAGSAVRVFNTALADGAIRFDTASPDLRAIDSSAPIVGALTSDGAVVDLYTLGGSGEIFGVESAILTVWPETPQESESPAEAAEPEEEAAGEEDGREQNAQPPADTPTRQPVEKLVYNVYHLGMQDAEGRYPASLAESALEDISAFTPCYSLHDFMLYTNDDGTLCQRVRFARFTLAAVSSGGGTVSVAPQAVGRGGSAVVTVEPDEGRKLASLLLNGVSVRPTEGRYVIGAVVEDLQIEARFADAAPTAIRMDSPADTAFSVPADGEAAFTSEPFAAVVTDGAGDAVDLPIRYSLSPETDGVSVDPEGRVTVTNAAKSAAAAGALRFTLTAAAEGTELRTAADFSVALEARRASRVEILRGERPLESDTLTIPSEGRTTTASYEARVLDQYGEEIDEQPAWSGSEAAGVSREENTLTVTDACAGDTSLVLTASASDGAVLASLEVRFAEPTLELTWPTVTLTDDPEYGLSWDELVTLSGGSATLNGAEQEGSFSLRAASALPNVSDRFTIVFTFEDENGETRSVESAEQTVTLRRKTITADMITLSPASTPYTGEAITPAVSLRDGTRPLTPGSDYGDPEYLDNILIGEGKVRVEGCGNYAGTAEKSFRITPIPASALQSRVVSRKPEDDAVEPTVSLRHGEQTLTEGADYDLELRYDVAARVGTATATLKGIYAGTLVLRFDLPDYQIVSGANAFWKKDSADGMSFRANGAFGKFTGLTVDGRAVDPKYYEAGSGSTVVKLRADYLKTLAAGKHILGVVYRDGKALAIFSVTEAARRGVATGDESNAALWLALMGGSGLALCGASLALYRMLRPGKKRGLKRKR